MKKVITYLGLVLSSASFATGSVTCNVNDTQTRFRVMVSVGRMQGSPILANSRILGFLKPNHIPSYAPASFRFKKFDTNRDQIPFWWVFKNQLRVGAYREDPAPGNTIVSTLLTIDAQKVPTPQGGARYVGHYTIRTDKQSQTHVVTNPVICMLN